MPEPDVHLNDDLSKKRDKVKGKRVSMGKDRKKVSVEDASRNAGSSTRNEKDEGRWEDQDGRWWIRDSVIENLKGKTWLSGREAIRN